MVYLIFVPSHFSKFFSFSDKIITYPFLEDIETQLMCETDTKLYDFSIHS